jgi:superfamily II DNA or RNA helicase/HKD family nuclease
MMSVIPDFIDNRKHQLVQVLQNLLVEAQEPTLDVVTAFFNLKGLELLSPAIEQLARFRLLLGKEQQQEFVVGERLLAELEDATARAEATIYEIQRWRDFLSQDKVQIRRYLKTFCHGKAYLVTGIPMLESVGIIGSSNFTGAGLTTNLELNAVLKQTSAVRELQEWFETLWAESEDYKAELLALLERFTRVYTPYEIYIKVIYEALRDKLDQDLSDRDERPSPIVLADFQHDGYLAAKEILENYGGVLIADSVGLGKTYLALRLLDDYAYRERQTALIICPAAIIDTVWRPLLQQHAIPYEIVSIERLSRRDFSIEKYAQRQIVVVDESHNFRNPDTNRWMNLFQLVLRGDDKKVILLTATPVNNTVFDLYHQLRFITRDDQHFLLAAGITDLQEYFWRAEQNREVLYEVLEALAVRRSRQFIRQNYPGAEIDGQKIRFPERKLHTVKYSLKETYGEDLYYRIAETIENLRLAPYQVETYRRELVEARQWQAKKLILLENKDEQTEFTVKQLQEALGWSEEQAHEFMMTVGRQTALAHIMRVLYLKRLESSIEALKISLGRLRGFLEQFLKALEMGRLLSISDYRQWLRQESSDEQVVEEIDFVTFLENLPELNTKHYDVEKLQRATQADLDALRGILDDLEKEHRDNKLETLKKLLTSQELVGKKIIVFSYFRDTARYLYKQLKSDPDFINALGHKRIAIVDSEVSPEERRDRVTRFAPRANKKFDLQSDEQIDLLISTDALSEGQNLQDGEVIINYDLHWNPIRMVQRIGRLDRLGSPHAMIHIYNFFPERELEELLGLLQRLHEKLDAINRTVGLDSSVLGEMPNPMDFNILRRLQREDNTAVQDLEAESELTVGEFLKQDLLQFLKDIGEEQLKHIPLGVGTARRLNDGNPGFFAAFRNPKTNRHHWLYYNNVTGRIEEGIAAIRHIRCDRSEPAVSLSKNFDPRPQIIKLREHLWNRIRAAELGPIKLPSLQRKIVNWLRALPPSAERNRLLQYFENQALTGPDLKELRHLWRERSLLPPPQLINRLLEFAEQHPHQATPVIAKTTQLAPEREEELECIAWMFVDLKSI